MSEDFHEIPVSDASSSFLQGKGSSVSPIAILLFAFCSPRCILRPFSFLHSPVGMSLFDCVSYEALYAPSCVAPRDYELLQRCSRSSRKPDIETIPCAKSRGSTLKDSMIGARFDSPSRLRRAFPAALRQTISRDVSRTWKPLRTIRSRRYHPIPSGCVSS